jgi:hypothetical protein
MVSAGSFKILKNGELGFDASTKSNYTLAVTSQQCTPNFGGCRNDNTQNVSAGGPFQWTVVQVATLMLCEGHIYLPDINKCLAVQIGQAPPYIYCHHSGLLLFRRQRPNLSGLGPHWWSILLGMPPIQSSSRFVSLTLLRCLRLGRQTPQAR